MAKKDFKPYFAEPDIWMRRNGDIYEYITVYINNLVFAVKNPKSFIKLLKTKYKFQFKESGSISYYLDANFEHDINGVLCMSQSKYITQWLASSYENLFGKKSFTKYYSLITKNDHPELDDSELFNTDSIQKYQSIIEVLQ